MADTAKKVNEALDEVQLKGISPNEDQFNNIVRRIEEIKSQEEISKLNKKEVVKIIEQVWPISKYVDK